jgi:putative phosphoribosyl transferase
MTTMTDYRPNERLVLIGGPPSALEGRVLQPAAPCGIVVLLRGDAGVHHSQSQPGLLAALHERGLATLEVELLTRDELTEDAFTKHLRFDVRLQAQRLAGVLGWLHEQEWAVGLPSFCFATGAAGAAALIADAAHPGAFEAIAMWGGRPDLAGRDLAQVSAPSLLLVEADNELIGELNRCALPLLDDDSGSLALNDPAELAPAILRWLEPRLVEQRQARAVGAA